MGRGSGGGESSEPVYVTMIRKVEEGWGGGKEKEEEERGREKRRGGRASHLAPDLPQ